MKPDPDKVIAQYNTVAAKYAVSFTGEHDKKPMDQKILRRFARLVEHLTPVWDFGCGPGQTTRFLKDLGVDISGLDFSDQFVKEASLLHPDISFQKGNILAPGFADNSIAAVVAFYSIVNYSQDQVKTVFEQVFRILNPGGVFLFTFHVGDNVIHFDEFLDEKVDLDVILFTTRFISRALEQKGFEKIEIIERKPYPGVEFQTHRAYVFAWKPETKT